MDDMRTELRTRSLYNEPVVVIAEAVGPACGLLSIAVGHSNAGDLREPRAGVSVALYHAALIHLRDAINDIIGDTLEYA